MTQRARVRIGTRGSPLALVQAEEVRRRLAAAWPELAAPDAIAIVPIKTSGDRIQDRTLADAGGKGLFTKEIEEALLAGTIDVAVHSMKDMPTWLPEGLTIDCLLPREDPRDVLIGPAQRIADLAQGAIVGTSSLRRQAQVLALRPDLRIVALRGNVETRLRKIAAGEADATLLALAGLRRLGMEHRASAVLSIRGNAAGCGARRHRHRMPQERCARARTCWRRFTMRAPEPSWRRSARCSRVSTARAARRSRHSRCWREHRPCGSTP